MRNLLAKTTLLLTLASYACPFAPAEAARFIDLGDVWSEKYINQLSDQGVINAEPDGKFRPNQPVTRAMLAYWLVKVLGLDRQPVSDKPSYTDVKPTDWFYKPVEIIRQNNYISGFSDGFRPNQYIQKAEMLSILARTLNTPVPDDEAIDKALNAYNDKSKIPPWAKAGVAQATIAGIIVTPKENILDPTAITTRGDAAAILGKLNQFVTKRVVNDADQTAQAAENRPSLVRGADNSPEYQGEAERDQMANAAPGQFLQRPAQMNPQTSVQSNQTQNQFQQPQDNQMLQGSVTVISAGTQFQIRLQSSLDSGSSRVGDPIEATISDAMVSNGVEVIPAGSKLLGTVTKVVSSKKFKFGANGSVAFKFTTIETKDGRKIPLDVSIADKSAVQLTGGSTAGRVGKGLKYAGIGTGSGALVGGLVGAGIASARGVPMGRSMMVGALAGGILGGAVGTGSAAVRKGSEVRILAGQSIPMRLDASLSVATPQAPPQQSYGGQQGGYQQQGGYPQQGGYQQPQGYPQQQSFQPPGYPSGYPQQQ